MLHLIKMWLEGIRFLYAVQDGLRHVEVQLLGLFCHLRGLIRLNSCPGTAQVASDVTKAVACVGHVAVSSDLGGETMEQFPVKRLGLKLVDKSAGIRVREAIIVFANRSCSVLTHNSLRAP